MRSYVTKVHMRNRTRILILPTLPSTDGNISYPKDCPFTAMLPTVPKCRKKRVLSPDGHCRPFDIKANGYSRGETVTVAYIQKMKNAKRIYAICPHIKLNNDGYKEEGLTYPSMLMQSTLLMEFYDECGIPKSCLDYIEAHGTATKVGDFQEVSALQNALCKNRETPLMIGSVKSNLGHAESASGFGQIAKIKQVIFAFIY
ncbi:fatty acid synthase-like [Solenopsis invicta]|uniref:fatty acid synthase-like n=1 Tax=Solenopsis invicta TaxID=13686 RepID=UPI00193EA30C|nr:fatty acid synthase-like [Solenopsis invicta]